MKCVICGQYEIISLSFSSLFYKESICTKCKKTYIPSVQTIVIPLQKGTIQLYSLFDWKNNDDILESRLFMFWEKLLKMAVSQQTDFDLLLWSDEEIWTTFAIWFRLFQNIGNIYVLSLFIPPIDFEQYM